MNTPRDLRLEGGSTFNTADRENAVLKLVRQGEETAVISRTAGLYRPTIYRGRATRLGA